MTDQGSVPPDLWQQIERMIDQRVAMSQRAASIRNASLSAGGTFTIQGGAFILKQADGRNIFYVGPIQPPRADGNDQPGWTVTRADGTDVLTLSDTFPTDPAGSLRQALAWRDRGGNTIFADDTYSGQGVARPYISTPLYPAPFNNYVGTSSTTFTDLFVATSYKQYPRLLVSVSASCDTSGATGEIRAMVNGVQLDATITTGFAIGGYNFGPLPIAGAHMSNMTVTVQGRMVSGTGSIKVSPLGCIGFQT